MQTDKNILIAFMLNFAFSVFECVGGIFTGSVAIVSDAIHDMGDAVSIGISYFLEKKSKQQPDENYTYGYARYSVFGSVITTVILLFGSVMVIFNAVNRIITPVEINYNGMIVFAIIGTTVNVAAAFFTRDGTSLNQKAVNLHMIEDVLGWIVVLLGAIVMKFTDFALIDPMMSIGVAVFILVHAITNLKDAMELFLEKTPHGINVKEMGEHIAQLEGVLDVHHIHIWSMDGQTNYGTMHIVTNGDAHQIKEKIRAEAREHGISHVTLELESEGEHCHEKNCSVTFTTHAHCPHH